MLIGERICGLDEAGRGPFAGPLLAAAVIFPVGYDFAEQFRKAILRDSKKLSQKQREALYTVIYEAALCVEVIEISVEAINAHGIGWANRTAFERLIGRVGVSLHPVDHYLVDGNLRLELPPPLKAKHINRIRADESIPAVAAASIVAKVTRDRIMTDLHQMHSLYGWDRNHGYGTKDHIAALRRYGATEHHRTQFIAKTLSAPLPGLKLS
ncbi:MAG TPA: ribonuclease HII [Aggregatilineales bacterium]|nr:ribonuclease HII [Anaerolineales bacterium]HRE47307.1 ribonuclease HII [Aggregatilineales bacterium]